MIKSITLKNWKSHKETNLKFIKGVNVLLGIMGSGKSSVLDAISYALYGTFPKLKRNVINTKDIIRHNSKESIITLTFEYKDVTWKIIRTINEKNTDAEIYKEGQLIQKGPRAVTTEIENILSVDYDLFTRSIYSEQNNMDYFFNLTPSKRKQEIDELLGLNKFETARANLTKLLNKQKAERRLLIDNLSTDEENETIEQINQLTNKNKILVNKINDTKLSYQTEKNKLLQLTENHNRITKHKTEFDNLNKQMSEVNGKVSILNEKVKDYQPQYKSDTIKIKLDTLNQQIKSNETKNENISKQIIDLQSQSNTIDLELKRNTKLKTEINELQTIKTNLEKEGTVTIRIEQKEKDIEQKETLRNQLAKNNNELDTLNENINKLKVGMSECPTCNHQLDNEHIETIKTTKLEKLKNITDNITKLQVNIKELTEKIENTNANLKRLEKIIDWIKEKKTNLIDSTIINQTKLDIDSKLKIINENNKIIKNNHKNLNHKKELLEKELINTKEWENNKNNLERYTAESLKIKEQLKNNNYDNNTFEGSMKDVQQSNITLKEIENTQYNLTKEQTSNNEILQIHNKNFEKIKQTKAKIIIIDENIDELNIYKNSLLETQIEIRNEMIEAINQGMQNLWEYIYPYKDYKKVRITASDKDYLFEIYKEGWQSVDKVTSGGEKSCLSITLRITMAMILTPNLSWLVLDEPTHNLDANAVNSLSETLRIHIPDIVEQTFIVTHDEKLINNDFGKVYKLKRDKSNDQDTEIEHLS